MLVTLPIIDAALKIIASIIEYNTELLKYATPEQKKILIDGHVKIVEGWNKMIDMISKLKVE